MGKLRHKSHLNRGDFKKKKSRAYLLRVSKAGRETGEDQKVSGGTASTTSPELVQHDGTEALVINWQAVGNYCGGEFVYEGRR